MNLSLCVHYSFERIYLAVVGQTARGMSIEYINSTTNGIDLDNPNDKKSLGSVAELNAILADIDRDIRGIYITLPSEYVLVTQFPGKDNLSQSDIQKLINIEVKQAYPQYNSTDYTFNVIPLAPRLNGTKMMMAEIIPNMVFTNAKKLLAQVKAPVARIEISQFNAHNAFLYNYPEEKDSTVSFFSIQDRFVDVSVVKAGVPAYYNLLKFNDNSELSAIFEKEIDRIMTDYVEFIDAAYLFGSGLTRTIYDDSEALLSGMVMKTGRLNAFRMFGSSLSDREKEYCRKTYHIFPPCVGSALPPSHERLKFFQ